MSATPGPGIPLPSPGVGRSTQPPLRGRRGVAALLLLIAAVTLVDAALIDRLHSQRAADLAAEAGAGNGTVAIQRAAVRHAAPVRLRIPRIQVATSLARLHKLKTGELQVPRRYDQAGWYVDSARPGDAGPTVLAGHVDSQDGPGVFFRLSQLKVGDLVLVDRSDLTRAAFTVTRVVRVPKRRFPTAQVYGGNEVGLRLITCGGRFDARSGHYRDNVIVFARPRGAT